MSHDEHVECDKFANELQSKLDRKDALLRELAAYGRHATGCSAYSGVTGRGFSYNPSRCNCGWTKLKERAEQEVK